MYWDIQEEGGFNFENSARNKMLEKKGMQVRTKKTGTTIVGIVYKDGVILGADTRATEGSIVADPDCLKIHYLAPNIYCCGAGTAADTEFVTQMVASELELHRLNTKRESRVSQVEARLTSHLFKYMGHIGAALIVGGVDVNGPSLVIKINFKNKYFFKRI
jgi:20S proteasome subunit beta 2